jgi:hypothetical protein
MAKLAAELPKPTCSMTDLTLLAQVAYRLDRDDHGGLSALSDHNALSCPAEIAAARLVEAVLQFVGVKHH